MSVDVIKFSLQTEIPDYLWLDDAAVTYQQTVADIFYDFEADPEQIEC